MTAPPAREHHDDDPPPHPRHRAVHGVAPTDASRAAPAAHTRTGTTRTTGTTTGRPHVGVGLTDAQRAALVELVQTAPLPPPEAMARLRGYLPPAAPD